MERHNDNALKIARWLKDNKKVETVLYPGLEENPQYEIAKSQMKGFSGMLSFYLKKGYKSHELIKNLEIPAYAVSLGDTNTFIEDPYNLTHFGLPAKIKKQIGITKNLLRLSVGLEDIEDLIEDFQNAFSKI